MLFGRNEPKTRSHLSVHRDV